jgi:conjugal transfer mating pair stabilization protein TraN
MCYLLSSFSWSQNTAEEFKKYQEYTRPLNQSAAEAMKHFDAKELFGSLDMPQESAYYQGELQDHLDLSKPTNERIKTEESAQSIINNFGTQNIQINLDNEAIKQAQTIEEHSDEVVKGKSSDAISCDKEQRTCTQKVHDEVCYASKQVPDAFCDKKRVVTVTSEHVNQRTDFTLIIPKKWIGSVAINLRTGVISSGISGQVHSRFSLKQPCQTMNAQVHSIMNNGQPANSWVRVSVMPSCSNDATLVLSIVKKWARVYPIQVAMTITASSNPFVEKDYWINECGALEQSGLCSLKSESCSEANTTHVINGLAVTRDCWNKKVTYSCSSAKADECRAQKTQGCFQLTSECARTSDLLCILYKQTYRCEEQHCVFNPVCLKNVYCADGQCVNTTPTSTTSEEFGQGVSQMASVAAIGKGSQGQSVSLFGGKAVHCKIWALDVIDCCSDKGWGKDLNLLHCRAEDKALGQAKLDYLVHYLGEYCAQDSPLGCVETKRTYCVFPSKMARIIQEARLTQLNSGSLGSAKEPTCAGLSIGEVQRLDFKEVNFINPIYPFGSGTHEEHAGIAEDIKVTSNDPARTIEEVRRRIERSAGAS